MTRAVWPQTRWQCRFIIRTHSQMDRNGGRFTQRPIVKKETEKNGHYYLLYIIVLFVVCTYGTWVQWALLGPSLDRDLILVGGYLTRMFYG